MQNSKECSIHKQECTGIDFSQECLSRDRYCCFDCVQQRKTKIYTYNEAQGYYLNIKNEFKQKKQDQNKRNLKIFDDLVQIVKEIEKEQSQQLYKLQANLMEQIEKIKANQTDLNQKLNSVTIDSYFEQKNDFVQKEPQYKQIGQILQTMLLKLLQQDLITKFSKAIPYIDDQVISFSPEYQGQNSDVKQVSKYIQQFQKYQPLNFGCPLHNEEIKNFDLSVGCERGKRICCSVCISRKKVEVQFISDVQQQWKEFELEQKNKLSDFQKQLQTKIGSVQEQLQKLKQQFLLKIDELYLMLSENQVKLQQEYESIINNMGKNWFTFPEEKVLDLVESLSKPKYKEEWMSLKEKEFKKSDNTITESVYDGILVLKIIEKQNLSQIESIIGKFFLTSQQQVLEQHFYFKKQYTMTKLNCSDVLMFPKYYVLQQQVLQANEWCSAIVFNKQQTLIAVGQGQNIITSCFNNGQISQSRLLSGRFNLLSVYIKALYFLETSNELVSGDNFGQLKIWKQQDDYQWNLVQEIDAHSCVNCIIGYEDQQQLITCGETIKFWKIQQNQQNCLKGQELNYHSLQPIYSIDLNDEKTQLVSSGADKRIAIYTVENGLWVFRKAIDVQKEQQRVCFIDSSQIAVQLNKESHMKIYKQDPMDQSEYKLSYKIKVQAQNYRKYVNKLVFNKEKKCLLNINGKTIHLVKKRIDGVYMVEQTIDFKSLNVFGVMSPDGSYIVTWDESSKQLQIRQLV